MTSARYPTKLEIEPIEMAVYLGGLSVRPTVTSSQIPWTALNTASMRLSAVYFGPRISVF